MNYTGEDGYPAAYILPVVIAFAGSRIYQLPNGLKIGYDEDGFQIVRAKFNLAKAREIVDQIYARGIIEETYWVEISKADLEDYLCRSYSC